MIGGNTTLNLDSEDIARSQAAWINYYNGTCYLNGTARPATGFSFAANDVVEVTAVCGTLTCLKNHWQVFAAAVPTQLKFAVVVGQGGSIQFVE